MESVETHLFQEVNYQKSQPVTRADLSDSSYIEEPKERVLCVIFESLFAANPQGERSTRAPRVLYVRKPHLEACKRGNALPSMQISVELWESTLRFEA